MNQPYDPNNPYGNPYGGDPDRGAYPPQDFGEPGYGQSGYDQPGYGQAGYGQPGYDQAGYPQSGHGTQGFGAQGYGQAPNQYGHGQQPPRPPKSRLPIFIAAGLVVVLAIGVTLFLVLRDDAKTAGGGGGGNDLPTAPEITTQFFQAVDDVDEDAMSAIARGDVLDDVDEIIEQGGTDLVTFADGELIADGAKQVDDVGIAVVVWEIEDPTESQNSFQLSVGLLDEDDGDGYKVCYIDDPSGDTGEISKGDDSAMDALVDDWEDEYAKRCDYQK